MSLLNVAKRTDQLTLPSRFSVGDLAPLQLLADIAFLLLIKDICCQAGSSPTTVRVTIVGIISQLKGVVLSLCVFSFNICIC